MADFEQLILDAKRILGREKQQKVSRYNRKCEFTDSGILKTENGIIHYNLDLREDYDKRKRDESYGSIVLSRNVIVRYEIGIEDVYNQRYSLSWGANLLVCLPELDGIASPVRLLGELQKHEVFYALEIPLVAAYPENRRKRIT